VVTRRTLLKAGLASPVMLTTLASTAGCASKPPSPLRRPSLQVLRNKDTVILAALFPVILAGNFPRQEPDKTERSELLLRSMDDFLARSSQFNHQALHELFDLLSFAPTRIAAAGLWRDWSIADVDDLNDFLIGWRDSRFNLLRMGYCQITQLTATVYYTLPESWSAGFYPGPPTHAIG
jgi:hypothetical protein